MAGWVFSVSRRASSGPSKHRRDNSNPSVWSASSKTARAEGKVWARLLPIPANCEPCPGKRKAVCMANHSLYDGAHPATAVPGLRGAQHRCGYRRCFFAKPVEPDVGPGFHPAAGFLAGGLRPGVSRRDEERRQDEILAPLLCRAPGAERYKVLQRVGRTRVHAGASTTVTRGN